MTCASPQKDTIVFIPPGSVDWATVITQFIVTITALEGRLYANWAGERLTRAIETACGAVALAGDGQLRGILLFELMDRVAELSLPWVAPSRDSGEIARALSAATVQAIRNEYPAITCLRAERQLLPGQADPGGLEAVGFHCAWRMRMTLQLADWDGRVTLPAGYHLHPWDIRDLDQAAEVMYRANDGTLDAQLYAPFFGASPAHCRKGLLAILAGKYGRVHTQASHVALAGHRLVGVNIIVDEESALASVVEISVDPSVQGQGIGRALLTQSLAVLRRERFECVELAVTKANLPALRLYESLDFQPAGDFPVCYWA